MRGMITLLGYLAIVLQGWGMRNTGKVEGKITDTENQPVQFATVVLQSALDSTLAKAGYTNEAGFFELPGLAPGKYFLKVSHVSHQTLYSAQIDLAEGQTFTFTELKLQPNDATLATVEIQARKPLIEVQPDKTVFNVEGSVNAIGNNAFDLLRKAPGVVIDNNDNLIVQGKNGVQIYIDGKPTPLTSNDLVALLKSIQSNEIEAIEVITNPSARYDAAGNAGIINIRMKKDKNLGANVNLNLGYAVGIYGKTNNSISGNYRSKKVNLFGSYSMGLGTWNNQQEIYREQSGSFFDQAADQNNYNENHNFKIGSDFFLNKKHTIGFQVSSFLSSGEYDSQSKTTIGALGSNTPEQILRAGSEIDQDRNNVNMNLNYRFEDTEKGSTWGIDADYGIYDISSNAYQPNFYKTPDEGQILDERIFTNFAPTDISIYTFKVDHERKLGKGKLGLGIKTAYVATDNTFDFYNVENETETLDPERSNTFEYRENVNAAYLSYGQQIKKWNVQAGFRVEQTRPEGNLIARIPGKSQEVNPDDYINIFPSGGLTYQLNDKHSLGLNYSRRIERPVYQDLNPFEYRLDELTYEKGNPFLRPQYTDNFQLSHTFQYAITTTLSYSRISNFFARITDTAEVRRSFITSDNVGDQRVINLSIGAPIPLAKWWSTYTSINAYRSVNEGTFRENPIYLKVYAFNAYMQHTFTLPKKMTLEVSGFFNSPFVWGGTFQSKSMGSVDLGLQRKLLKDRANLKISVSDVFRTLRFEGENDEFDHLFIRASGTWESQQLKINFSYLFGNDQIRGRNHKTGLEEEAGRVKSGS